MLRSCSMMRFGSELSMMKRVLATLVVICLCLSLQVSQAQQTHSQPLWPSPSASTSNAQPGQSKPTCTNNGTYLNKQGQTVPRPENCSAAPAGASAQCRDGKYSFSKSRRGTCSHHGGVAKWL